MQLQDFNTLAEAQTYEVITYKVIPTSAALQFFLSEGVEDALHNKVADPTLIDVAGKSISIGSVCRGVLQNTTGFNVDPSLPMGQFNLGVIAILVSLNIITQEIADAFIALGQTVTTPFANKNEHEFQVAKGTISTVLTTPSAKGDYAIMTTNAVTPSHNPRLTTLEGTAIESFKNVSLVGMYVAKIPNQYMGQDLYVDNAYNVVI